jgi:hypothetical protein
MSSVPGRFGRAFLSLLLIGSTMAVLACGGGGSDNGGGGTPPLTANFAGSTSVASADLVRLTGGTASGDTVTVNVVIGGISTSSDIYSFAMDLTLSDPTVARLIPGSAQVGTALTTSGGQTITVLADQASGSDTIVLGASHVGGGAGNSIAAGEPIILSLSFEVLKVGSTTVSIAAPPTSAALDSLLGTIGSVTFDPAAATLSGI